MAPASQNLHSLFLEHSYKNLWTSYQKCLQDPESTIWDYVFLTASDQDQASAYRKQIHMRLKQHRLPKRTRYIVLPDPEGKRVGSGGATFQVLRSIAEKESAKTKNPFVGLRILVIHSGGDSKRLPQYSAIGKVFLPIPRKLPDGRLSTLFDELFICMSGIASQISGGMLSLSGDVLLLFNPQQIDFQFYGSASISTKADVRTGKNHGVFLQTEDGHVRRFLHKKTETQLYAVGAVDEWGTVDVDTGAVLFDSQFLYALYSCVCEDGCVNEEKYSEFVSEEANLSLYGDFLFPLAADASLGEYLKEHSEGKNAQYVQRCRKQLWKQLKPYALKLFSPSPSEFIHLGTNTELLTFHCKKVCEYSFFAWKKQIASLTEGRNIPLCSLQNSFIGLGVKLEDNSYMENSWIDGNVSVGSRCILSNVKISEGRIPDGTVLHGLPLKEGGYVVRIFHLQDNPKEILEKNASFLGLPLSSFLRKYHLAPEVLWDTKTHRLWDADLYPIGESLTEAVMYAFLLLKLVSGCATEKEYTIWHKSRRFSLKSSFSHADTDQIYLWESQLRNKITAKQFIRALAEGQDYKEIVKLLPCGKITPGIKKDVLREIRGANDTLKLRSYYALSQLTEHPEKSTFERRCFHTVRHMVSAGEMHRKISWERDSIQKEKVTIRLPLRVNWGGGWSDTPPYCIEHGGTVLNAAVKLDGIFPVEVSISRIPWMQIEFSCEDSGVIGIATDIQEITNCANVYDAFSLHKACLIACGLIPKGHSADLRKILEHIGGGLHISTQAINVPRGSGLGTSSILAAACVKGLFELFSLKASESDICQCVMKAEQLMETGGGWQDQFGGLLPGIKYLSSGPGSCQIPEISVVKVPSTAQQELQERFTLIYSGQRRLARNILREVMGNYIGGNKEIIQTLEKIQWIAACMRLELEKGNLSNFSHLMSQHWELSKQLDPGITNTCIEQIFFACQDLIDGKFIPGAGGGGFLQVLLKPGIPKSVLKERVYQVFRNSGAKVWDSELWFG